MIKNPDLLKKFEDDFKKKEGLMPYRESLKIFEEMWKEAVYFKVFPPKDPMEGIDLDIKIARILNSCLKNSSQR